MATRTIFVLIASIALSGCCELFGICTSVNLHTSASPQYKLASQDKQMSPAQAPASQLPAATLAGLDSSTERLR
jgi:hypothetical protein